ncbi:glucosidase [Microlunatus endophyticus]|uniref:Glucosidase n=1 Tax=Microlunatus endophyticus TaxID=1716077 RepID=A0A917S4F6_9ACTN|nr:glucosidase [Microlunatus endophyticus]GGL54763.1 glucosidase [Microlunatus endophyticus]
MTAEHDRLARVVAPTGGAPDEGWRLWGPYLAGRQWGTVREDYSADGDAWDNFDFDQAQHRAYRWGEDGIGGICDRYGFLNLAVALWNGNDDRLKERYFGLSNGQGNHGEDAKEYWWHLDATPTHSYAELLYRYPQQAFPYADLRAENDRRGYGDEEYELADTGILADDRFFDVLVTHAKASPTDIVIEISATNHGPDPARLDLVPQIWFRNTWSWGDPRKPSITGTGSATDGLTLSHGFLGDYRLTWQADTEPEVLRCDNETNTVAAFGSDLHQATYPKDAVERAIVYGDRSGLAPDDIPVTKAALRWSFPEIQPGATVTVRVRLTAQEPAPGRHAANIEDYVTPRRVAEVRKAEADEFYDAVIGAEATAEDRATARRAFAGLLWCKQLFRYDVRRWLDGDPGQPTPPPQRLQRQPLGRNTDWTHLYLADIISMPDEWEYPWFASWDLAFHCVALAHIDPGFAKDQLTLICREWAMHPNGQLPAYEWNFSDVNPPVHAWAAWQVYQLDGARDREFLTHIAAKLLLNFGWWVNRKDTDDSYLFEGGFLGMDNIGLFDRSDPLPDGHHLEQSDATSWMAFFCLGMLAISWELARTDRGWDGIASKFLEHFLLISEAMTSAGNAAVELWNESDGFYYDAVVFPDGTSRQIPVRTMVGLLPLVAVAVQPDWVEDTLPDFTERLGWLARHRPQLTDAVLHVHDQTTLALLDQDRLQKLLTRLLDEQEFLSPHGIRAVSTVYRTPVTMEVEGVSRTLAYTPAESDSGLFGGNSNWRGPVWFPVNVLITDALRSHALRDLDDVGFPTGSGSVRDLAAVADAIDDRLISLFRIGPDGRRPSDPRHVPTGPLWQAHPTFSEYFHGDEGRGLGASHQTGWTAVVAHLICQQAQRTTQQKEIGK